MKCFKKMQKENNQEMSGTIPTEQFLCKTTIAPMLFVLYH